MQKKYKVMINTLGLFCLIVLAAWYLNKPKAEKRSEVKNVIVMVADGYGPGALSLYREWNHLKALPTDRVKHIGLMYTNSANDYVTDSGAAATAMGTSVRTYNQGIGVDAKGNPITNLSEAFKKQGKAVGLVSTNTLTDATPAGFAAHSQNRHQQDLISLHYVNQHYDVLLGGGRRKWVPKEEGGKRKDGQNIIQLAKRNGYTYVETAEELKKADGEKLLGLFHDSYMSFKIDRQEGCMAAGSQEPTLKEMTLKALNILSQNNNGFFLMSEGARIDHAAHAIDVHAMMHEIREFYDALTAVYEWASRRNDTLVIVVSDHDTMALNPTQLTRYDAFRHMKCSAEDFITKLDRSEQGEYNPSTVETLLKKNGVENPSQRDLELILSTHKKPAYKAAVAVGQVVAKQFGVTTSEATVNWETGTAGHSSTVIPVFSIGVGADHFQGVYHNTAIAKKIGKLTGTSHTLGQPYVAQDKLASSQ